MAEEDTSRWIVDSQGQRYRVLGESGLVEYENGDIVDVVDVDVGRHPVSSPPPRQDADNLTPKDPAYWYFFYDERYCGPSIEDYARRQAERYRQDGSLPWPGTVIPGELSPEYVAQEQAAIDRRLEEIVGERPPSTSGGQARWRRSRRERWEDLELTLFTIAAFGGLVLLVRYGYAEMAGRLIFVPIGTLTARIARLIADYKARRRCRR